MSGEGFAPKPLSAVSPSTYDRLRSWKAGKECALRLAWSHNTPMLAPSAAAKVGDIFHEVMEAAKSRLSREQAESLWDEKSRKVDLSLSAHWVSKGLAPLSATASGYTLKRLMTLRRVCSASQHRSERREGGESQSFSSPIREKFITSPDALIRGKVDLVVERADGWHLIDYKSGAVSEDDSSGAHQLKESYELQLLMYAALLKEAEGIEIKSACLSTLDGKEHYLSVDLGKAERVAAEARRLLLEFNQLVEDSSGEPQSLAKPLPTSREEMVFGCSACLFRPQCKAYISVEKESGDGNFWPRDVIGVVAEIKQSSDRYLVSVIQKVGDVESQKVVNLSGASGRHPSLEGLQVGMRIGIFDLAASRTMLIDVPRTCAYRMS